MFLYNWVFNINKYMHVWKCLIHHQGYMDILKYILPLPPSDYRQQYNDLVD